VYKIFIQISKGVKETERIQRNTTKMHYFNAMKSYGTQQT